jgi:hypothetical protein
MLTSSSFAFALGPAERLAGRLAFRAKLLSTFLFTAARNKASAIGRLRGMSGEMRSAVADLRSG